MAEPSRSRRALDRLAPPGTRGRTALALGRDTLRESRDVLGHARDGLRQLRAPRARDIDYGEWLQDHRADPAELDAQAVRLDEAEVAIGVDCVVIANGDSGALQATTDSLEAQSRPPHSLTTVEPGQEQAQLATLGERSRPDDLTLVVEAGDLLEPDLLFQVLARGWDNPRLDLIHWDEDLLDGSGRLHDPRFKPSFSPETLLSANYLGRSFAVRNRRLAESGGIDWALGADRWWDLLLRLGLEEEQVGRIPRVLQHLRKRPEVGEQRALELVGDRLRETGAPARVEAGPAGVRVRWELDEPPTVSIVIPTRRRETLLRRCLELIEKTDYPRFDLLVVDSGERDEAAEGFYREWGARLDLGVHWWEGEFNYSAANNAGASACEGEVIVFCNDDVEAADPEWLAELVGWATRPEIGVAGLQLLLADGRIQHSGVILGLTSFADHIFAGMRGGEETMLGRTDWYRDVLAVTGACAAVERSVFETIGGFDERFQLCGSDVVLGLDSHFHGLRNVCSAQTPIRHLEQQTRAGEIPAQDFFCSYWRYARWLRAGDPYFSPNLSTQSTEPRLRAAGEPSPLQVVAPILGQDFGGVYRQLADEEESRQLARNCRADAGVEAAIRSAHEALRGPREVRSVNWFLLGLDSPFYGGVNTALRIADRLQREHQVENRFVLAAAPNERFARSALSATFPALADSPIEFTDGRPGPGLDALPEADAAIATQWATAYVAAHFEGAQRRFYMVQDFDPMFYPAGTNYALAEETLRFGFYGLCNTERILDLYRGRYGGEGMSFMPAVDPGVFHAEGRDPVDATDAPVTIFIYARPGVWRNCWELASVALEELKRRLGQRVRILTAGSWAQPDDLGRGIEHLGLLDYRDTGALYRHCDIGVALTVSEHPSYLPLELLACGVPVVAFDNPAGDWILGHEENCLRCPSTADGLREALERLAGDPGLRGRLSRRGLEDIAERHGDWGAALASVYPYLCDPGAG